MGESDSAEDERLRLPLARLDLDALVGGGGLQPVNRFASRLPSQAVSMALSQPHRLGRIFDSFDSPRRQQLSVAVAAAGAAKALKDASGAPGKRFTERISEMLSAFAAPGIRHSALGLSRGLDDQWLEQIRRSASLAADAVRSWRSETAEGLPGFVAAHGWPIPVMDVTAGELAVWVDLTDAPRPEVRRRVMTEFAPGTQRFRQCRERLIRSPAMSRHRPALTQGIRAYERGDRYAAISTLLPLIEGAIGANLWEPGAAPRSQLVRRGIRRIDERNPTGWEWLTQSLEVVLLSATGNALFDSDSSGVRSGRRLNRHAVLHGRANRYGTSENALRLFLVLCTLADILEHVE